MCKSPEQSPKSVVVAAVCLVHPDRPELLMVRKKGTSSFMLPGGKIEPEESPLATAVREIAEELHLDLDPDRLDLLGSWTTDAANEPNTYVTGTVFAYRGTPDGLNVQDPRFFNEIDEAEWFPIADLPQDTAERSFAPLTRNRVIPELLARGLAVGQVK